MTLRLYVANYDINTTTSKKHEKQNKKNNNKGKGRDT